LNFTTLIDPLFGTSVPVGHMSELRCELSSAAL
jgi:hypothetical protein